VGIFCGLMMLLKYTYDFLKEFKLLGFMTQMLMLIIANLYNLLASLDVVDFDVHSLNAFDNNFDVYCN
jgi:hypothetical protein